MKIEVIVKIIYDGRIIKKIPIEKDMIIGRNSDCDICLVDKSISRQHALLKFDGEVVQIEKKSNFSPLYLNGEECKNSLIKEGDQIKIGPYLIDIFIKPFQVPSDSLNNELPIETTIDLSGKHIEEQKKEIPPESKIDLLNESEEARTKTVAISNSYFCLIFPDGSANFNNYIIKKNEVFIGRDNSCDIVLLEKKSSRKHALICKIGAQFCIKDLNSSNGILVNGVKIQEKELVGDDIIKIGNTEFTFKALSLDYIEKEKDFLSISNSDINISEEFISSPSSALINNDLDLNKVSNIVGLSGSEKEKKTLLDKFKTLPKIYQVIIILITVSFFWWYMSDDVFVDSARKTKNKKIPISPKSALNEERSFESLSPELKKFIETQHDLAFDYYKNQDFDKAIYEVQKIFGYIQNYKDSKEIERYAKEGKRKMDAIEDERHKKEEEKKLKEKISELVNNAQLLMNKKEYEKAKDIFSQILSIDPENSFIGPWKKEISDYEDQLKFKEQQKNLKIALIKEAASIMNEGIFLKRQGKYNQAIVKFKKILEMEISDQKIKILSKKLIDDCFKKIKFIRDPVLLEAKKLEESGDLKTSFNLYKKAISIDPTYQAGYLGESRIKTILHDRAKRVYTEAVLAESYSDFVSAKKLYEECMNISPSDDIYYERAKRKLTFYFQRTEGEN